MSIPVVTFVGRSGAGKTTLLVKLIGELTRRGHRVATVKHHSHGGFEVDQPGKDSWRHARAGSQHVVIVAPDRVASYRGLERELPLEEIVASIERVDIILVEGYKQAALPTFEVVRAENGVELVGRTEHRFGVAADLPLNIGVPQFSLEDVEGIADLIEQRFLVASPAVTPSPAGMAQRPGDEPTRLSYAEALQRTLDAIVPLGHEVVALSEACGRVAAQDLLARVDSPSLDASLKDGYAVRSEDIADAAADNPIQLRLLGVAAAGQAWHGELEQGTAVRILTGAPIPDGAEAVVSAEFATDDGQTVTVLNDSRPGRNILSRASDIATGQSMAEKGEVLEPTVVGLLAAAGHAQVPVFRQPRVAILATGDEVVAPGRPLEPGRLYASNLVTLAAWCAHYGLSATTAVIPDEADEIRAHLVARSADHDVILTSGGAWRGERDLVVRLLDELGWEKVYHRVRIGPGKAVGFGLLAGKPVFCLPGGPPSNHMAFLQLALPGLHRLEGRRWPGLPVLLARLSAPIRGQRDWTQFVPGRLVGSQGGLTFQPLRLQSRLQEMAVTEGIVMIPDGTELIPALSLVRVQLLAGALTSGASILGEAQVGQPS